MGLLICRLCNQENIAWDGSHVCARNKIEDHIERLKDERNKAEQLLREARDAVALMATCLTPETQGEVAVPAKWLKQLWSALGVWECHTNDVEGFLQRWVAACFAVSAAFDLFRQPKHRNHPTDLLGKLTHLRKCCEGVNKAMGWGSDLPLTPEEVAQDLTALLRQREEEPQ